MYCQVLSKNPVVDELLPLEEVMEYLRVYDSTEEPLLNTYRHAAIAFAETYTNRFFGSGSVLVSFDKFQKSVQLPYNNIAYISGINAHRGIGSEHIGEYRFNAVSNRLTFLKDYSDYSEFIVHLEIDCPVSSIPAPLKLGMLKLIATWYENREDISNGVSVAAIPMNHKHCFDLYRLTPTGG